MISKEQYIEIIGDLGKDLIMNPEIVLKQIEFGKLV